MKYIEQAIYKARHRPNTKAVTIYDSGLDRLIHARSASASAYRNCVDIYAFSGEDKLLTKPDQDRLDLLQASGDKN